ncbi:MAG: 28S ribosomal protein S35, mitochondrial, partial [Paramarteilia canceri]
NRRKYEPKLPPGPEANLELIKISNFLHLTPNHIKQHCEMIRSKFCNFLPTEDKEFMNLIAEEMPIDLETIDFLYDSPHSYDERSRKVTLSIKVEDLKLSKEQKAKLVKLAGNFYNFQENKLKIVADKCPLRSQNIDYSLFLLQVLYRESKKLHHWEKERTLEDLIEYDWDKGSSKTFLKEFENKVVNKADKETIKKFDQYKKAVEEFHNKPDDSDAMSEYKNAVLDILKLS